MVNFLKLSSDKTKMIILSSPYFAKARPHYMIINLNGELIHPNKSVRNLGVNFDNTMNMDSRMNKVCQIVYTPEKYCFKIKHYIVKDAWESLVHTFVTSRLDSVNAILHGLSKFLIEKLQRVWNFSARLISGSYEYDHITSDLKSLPWLPIEQRIRHNITVLDFKSVYMGQPLAICRTLLNYTLSGELKLHFPHYCPFVCGIHWSLVVPIKKAQ